MSLPFPVRSNAFSALSIPVAKRTAVLPPSLARSLCLRCSKRLDEVSVLTRKGKAINVGSACVKLPNKKCAYCASQHHECEEAWENNFLQNSRFEACILDYWEDPKALALKASRRLFYFSLRIFIPVTRFLPQTVLARPHQVWLPRTMLFLNV